MSSNRLFSRDVTELISAMLVHIYVSRFSHYYVQTRSKIAIPSSDPDHVVQIPLFDYVKKLDVKVRERYLKKISTIGIDPVLIGGKHFEPDCLPPVESTHLLCYFVFKTSYYTQKSLPQSRGLQSNPDYYREGWDNKLRSLFGMQGRPSWIMFAHS